MSQNYLLLRLFSTHKDSHQTDGQTPHAHAVRSSWGSGELRWKLHTGKIKSNLVKQTRIFSAILAGTLSMGVVENFNEAPVKQQTKQWIWLREPTKNLQNIYIRKRSVAPSCSFFLCVCVCVCVCGKRGRRKRKRNQKFFRVSWNWQSVTFKVL